MVRLESISFKRSGCVRLLFSMIVRALSDSARVILSASNRDGGSGWGSCNLEALDFIFCFLRSFNTLLMTGGKSNRFAVVFFPILFEGTSLALVSSFLLIYPSHRVACQLVLLSMLHVQSEEC